jgi:phosphoglycerate dehydrogenase-like enzyme
MLAVALVPPSADPKIAEAAYPAVLGEGWTVRAYNEAAEVPDAVAAEAEFLLPPPPRTVDASLLKRMPKLRLIQVPGHGYDHVNLDDARAAGVPVATVAGSGAEAHTVAEMAIILAGVASRRVLEADAFMRGGGWGSFAMLQHGVFELAGKTLGLVGFGRIGREVLKRALAFDMRVLYYDVVKAEVEGAEFRDLDALLGEADVVSLHTPLTPETEGLINDRTLALMKPTAVIVNTARGPLVDAPALAKALRDGRIRGAAIDVFDTEPPAKDNPLLGAPNIVLSPHMAGVTAESIMRIIAAALENCKRVARGEKPLDVVSEPGGH